MPRSEGNQCIQFEERWNSLYQMCHLQYQRESRKRNIEKKTEFAECAADRLKKNPNISIVTYATKNICITAQFHAANLRILMMILYFTEKSSSKMNVVACNGLRSVESFFGVQKPNYARLFKMNISSWSNGRMAKCRPMCDFRKVGSRHWGEGECTLF